jgi:hypothetical protein
MPVFTAIVVVMTVQELAGAAVEDTTHSVAEVTTAAAVAGVETETSPAPEAIGRLARSISVALITPVPVKVGLIPATAELISSSLASKTRSFSLKMQPGSSSAVSQLFPLAVGSPI